MTIIEEMARAYVSGTAYECDTEIARNVRADVERRIGRALQVLRDKGMLNELGSAAVKAHPEGNTDAGEAA